MMPGPLIMISSFSPSLTSLPGNTWPTEPNLYSSGWFTNDPAAEAVPDLVEDELVEQRVLLGEQERHRLALALAPVDLEADLERLLEDLLLQPALRGLHGDYAAV